MSIRIIAYIIGSALKLEAAFLLLPLLCALIYGEALFPYAATIALCALLGFLLCLSPANKAEFQTKEGFVATGLVWIVLSLMGMLPFLLSGSVENVCDAFFETVSGLTTTGASILTDVEKLPHALLLWRSFMHWIGGMGILVFMLTLLPFAGGSQMNLMKAESPGPSISKLVPRAKDTAKILYGIYAAMTVLTIMILLLLRMPLFDALCISFGAAGTGGFSILNSGCATYTIAQQNVITVAMIAFGVNFNFYYLLFIHKAGIAFKIEEVRWYLLIIGSAIILITVNLLNRGVYSSLPEALQISAFHVGSIITTTGYATTDVNLWPNFSQGILVLLMFCGACAGSTGGGLKVSRLILLFRSYTRELSAFLHPGIVRQVHMDGKPVEPTVLRSTSAYFFIYMVIFAVSLILLSPDTTDWITDYTAVAATFNNIGPGLGMVGTIGNYSEYSAFSKLVLSADMLIGRLEIFPIMLLFARGTWRKF